MMGVGALGVGATNMLFTSGVNLTNASDTALLYAVVPVWGMILGFVLGFERPTSKGILGVGIAFLGTIVVVYGGLGGSGSSLEGNLLVLGATVCWGSYTVLSLPLLEQYSPLVVAAYTMLFGGLSALPLALPGFLSVDWGVVGSRLLDRIGGRIRVLRLAEGGFTSRGQQGARLPVPHYPYWSHLGRHALG